MTRRSVFYACVEVVCTAAILLGAWRYTEANSSLAFARFGDIWDAFDRNFLFDRIQTDLLPTLRRLGISFGLAVIIGGLIGLVLGHSRFLRLLTAPLIAFKRAIPSVALIPPAIILIGIEDNMKIILTVAVALWPVAFNTMDGVAEIDDTMKDTSRAFRLSRRQRMRYLTIPSVAPRIFTGMQLALAFSLILVIVTEYLIGTEGLGYILNQAQSQFLIPQMWATILLLGILGYSLNAVLAIVRHRTLYWIRPASMSHE